MGNWMGKFPRNLASSVSLNNNEGSTCTDHGPGSPQTLTSVTPGRVFTCLDLSFSNSGFLCFVTNMK